MNIICGLSIHRWKVVGTVLRVSDPYSSKSSITHYTTTRRQCQRCGKVVEVTDRKIEKL